ncbi:MAG: methyltransferase domain-containing protein [Bryobacterales bacterium]|nr:methyltransferase domain-containing protein [Bryobacterales bacterium]
MPPNQWDSSLYDDKHNFVTRHGEDLLQLLAPQPGERILDAGCGTGHLTAAIAASGAVAVGMDNSPEMLAKARECYPQIEFVPGDVTDFSFPQPFDAIFSNAALHWVRAAEDAARCMARALRPGGRLAVEFGGAGNILHIAEAVRAAILHVTGRDQPHQWYFPSIGEYAAVLERSGFQVEAAWLFPRWTPLEGDTGIRDWIRMFRGGMIGPLTSTEFEEVLRLAEDSLRGVLYRDGRWHAGYKRLRVCARKVLH